MHNEKELTDDGECFPVIDEFSEPNHQPYFPTEECRIFFDLERVMVDICIASNEAEERLPCVIIKFSRCLTPIGR